MSEQYIVSARKYRPQTFDTVVGQEHITTTLKNAIIKQQIAHAYLFCGPRGVGKTTCARILARTINCENPTADMEACGTCSTCVAFKDNTAFNIFELDAASNNSVDDIRALTDQVRFAPQTGKYKIYIIDEVHMLSSAAFNAFLKTLEEPPSYAIFILATTEKHKILPTILSRCQIFDFKRITTNDTVNHLASIATKESIAADNNALHIIAQKSEGCMRDALSMMDRIASFTNGNISYDLAIQHLNILDADVYFKLCDLLLAKDVSGALVILDEVLQKGFEGDVIMNGFAEHLRNVMLCKDARMAKLLDVAENHKRVYFDKAQIIPSEYLVSALSILNQSEIEYRQALNKRLHLEICFIKLCYLSDVITTEDLNSVAKKKLSNKNTEEVSTTQTTASNTLESNAAVAIENVAIGNKSKIVELSAGATEEIKTETPTEVKSAIEKPTAPAKRSRFSKDLLQDVHNEIAHQEQEKVEVTPITEELLISEQANLINYLRGLEKTTLTDQLSLVTFSAKDENTVNIQCFTQVGVEIIGSSKDLLQDYFIAKTNNKSLIILVTLDPKAVAKEVNTERPLNKTEIYEEMIKENNALAELKQRLNLYID